MSAVASRRGHRGHLRYIRRHFRSFRSISLLRSIVFSTSFPRFIVSPNLRAYMEKNRFDFFSLPPPPRSPEEVLIRDSV